jgi:hypothetical protein
MTPLEAVALVGALVIPLHWLVWRELDRLADPQYLRDHGVVIVRETALQACSDPVGSYRGRTIWGTVTFMGMPYRFDHITQPRDRERIGPGQLYLEPGLVYVAA